MKKLGIILSVLTLTTAFSVSTAFAQTAEDPITYLPEDTTIVYQVDLSQESFIKDLVTFISLSQQTDSESGELIAEIIEDNMLTIAMTGNLDEDPNTIVIGNITPEQATEATVNASNSSAETYQGQELIITQDYTVFFYNDHFIFTNNTETAKAVADVISRNIPSLSNNASYQNVTQTSLENMFLHMYINLKEFMENTPQNNLDALVLESFPGIIDIISAESIQINQNSDGFNALVQIEGNPSAMQSKNLAFNKYDFTPSLYQQVPGEDIILFQEFNNIQGALNDFGYLDEDWKNEVKEEMNISVDKDILPLMSGQGVLAIHNANDLYPGVTLYFDISNNLNAPTLVTALNMKLKEYWEETYSADEYEYRIDPIHGTSFYTHAFLLDDEFLVEEVALRMAIKNNLLIISIHPDLQQLLQGGSMMDNQDFQELFHSPGRVSDLEYFSIRNLRNYFLATFSTLQAAGEEYQTTADILNILAELLEPWRDAYGVTRSEKYLATAEATVRVNVNGFSTYPALFEELGATISESFSSMYKNKSLAEYLEEQAASTQFCDVTSSDWYYTSVMSLTRDRIVKGYSDGCFHPDDDITRAEFLKMVREQYARYGANSLQLEANPHQNFSDVPSQAWFAPYVSAAVKAGYVQGYPDGTFRPNATITRAEAIQILYNFNEQPQIPGSLSFRDVQQSDWFYPAVLWAKGMHIAQGTTTFTFEPNRNLNRAEAATLVYKTW